MSSQDVRTITQALELYYSDKGYYANIGTYTPGSTVINYYWSTTADGSWANLAAELKPYVDKLPSPPGKLATNGAVTAGNSYDYYGFYGSYYCNSATGQGYILVYHQEGSQRNDLLGNCPGNALGPYTSSSNYRVVK